MNSGELKAMIATWPIFMGPARQKPAWQHNDFEKMKMANQPMVCQCEPTAFITYTPDAAVALYMLSEKRKCLWTNLAPSYCETCIDGQ